MFPEVGDRRRLACAALVTALVAAAMLAIGVWRSARCCAKAEGLAPAIACCAGPLACGRCQSHEPRVQ